MYAITDRKAIFKYKQVSPEMAYVKTQAVLRILVDALKQQQEVLHEADGEYQKSINRLRA